MPLRASVFSKGKVLLVGNDPSLQRSRELLLRRSGYSILDVNSNSALDCPDLASFQLALICHSVLPEDALRIAAGLHSQAAHLPVLRFATFGESPSDQFAITMTSMSSPALLLSEIERLVSPSR